VQVLTSETPDFIVPTLWPANSPDNQPVRLLNLVGAAGACVPQPDSLRHPAEVAFYRKVGTIQIFNLMINNHP